MVSIAMNAGGASAAVLDRPAVQRLDGEVPSGAHSGMQPVSLRVSGGKPMRLRAQALAEGNSWRLGTHAWHEVQMFRRDTGEYVVGIKCFKKAAGDADIFHAELFPNLEEAVAFLEGFDPTADLSVDIDASDRSVSAAEIALKAAALRQRADEITRQWRALVGEMLYRLDAAE